MNSELVPNLEPTVWMPSAGFLPGDDEDLLGDPLFFVAEVLVGPLSLGRRGRELRRQLLWEAWSTPLKWMVRARARDHWRRSFERQVH